MSQPIIALTIFILAIAMFVWQRIPAGLTAMLASLAMMLTGVITTADVVSPFGSDTVIMVASCMILGTAVFETGAAETIGKCIIANFSQNTKMLLIMIVFAAAILSAFLSNTAVVAMFLPLLASAAKSSGGGITKKGTYMATGIAAVVGGNCTLAGSTPQLTAQAILSVTDGVRKLTFWELGKIGVPLVLLLMAYYWFVGDRLQSRVFTFDEAEPGDGEAVSRGSDPKPRKQLIVFIILAACIAGFSTGIYSLGTVAALAAVLCILTNCISFKSAFQLMDWNTILVLGGAMALSTGLNDSGLIGIVAEGVIALCGGSSANPVLICTILILLSAVIGNGMSHTATAAALTPLAISVALTLGVNPITYVVAIIVGCSLAFATPIATPPLTMTLTAGYRFSDYTKVGGLYSIISIIAACILIPLLYGL